MPKPDAPLQPNSDSNPQEYKDHCEPIHHDNHFGAFSILALLLVRNLSECQLPLSS